MSPRQACAPCQPFLPGFGFRGSSGEAEELQLTDSPGAALLGLAKDTKEP